MKKRWELPAPGSNKIPRAFRIKYWWIPEVHRGAVQSSTLVEIERKTPGKWKSTIDAAYQEKNFFPWNILKQRITAVRNQEKGTNCFGSLQWRHLHRLWNRVVATFISVANFMVVFVANLREIALYFYRYWCFGQIVFWSDTNSAVGTMTFVLVFLTNDGYRRWSWI